MRAKYFKMYGALCNKNINEGSSEGGRLFQNKNGKEKNGKIHKRSKKGMDEIKFKNKSIRKYSFQFSNLSLSFLFDEGRQASWRGPLLKSN